MNALSVFSLQQTPFGVECLTTAGKSDAVKANHLIEGP